MKRATEAELSESTGQLEPWFSRVLAWRETVIVDTDGSDVVANDGGLTVRLRKLPKPVLDSLIAGVDLDSSGRGHVGAQQLLARLDHLAATRLSCGRGEVMQHESFMRGGSYEKARVDRSDVVRLDRFSLLRNRGHSLVLEGSRSRHRFVLTSALARGLAADLGAPHMVSDLMERDEQAALLLHEIIEHWVGAGLVELANDEGAFESDADPVLAQWDFHDLLMHTRSRGGRFDQPWGALSPYRGQIEPLPAAVTPRQDTLSVIELPDPQPWVDGLSLSKAVNQRRSIRDYGKDPITVGQLSSFLYRSFRDRARFDPLPGTGLDDKVARPYPSGGGIYEHELYLTVQRCEGLAQGIYHYDALNHRLELVTEQSEVVTEMLNFAASATGHPGRPDVLLTLTARFQRMAWRYRSIAYANILRNTGAIYQTMYLIAEDLGLAACALGNGDADLSARALGLDYLKESSVGDFILGQRNPEEALPGSVPPGWTLLNGNRVDPAGA